MCMTSRFTRYMCQLGCSTGPREQIHTNPTLKETHLAARRTARRHTCKDCGRKSWGPRSPRNRAACPGTPGWAGRTGAEGGAAAAGRPAGDSWTGTKAPGGYSPSRQRTGNRHRDREKDKKYNQWRDRFKNKIKNIYGWIHNAALIWQNNQNVTWLCVPSW